MNAPAAPSARGDELWKLLLAAGLARLVFLAVLPALAVSADLRHWLDVGLVLKGRGNPYAATPYLNWPPLWLEILYGLLRLSYWLEVPFFRTIQAFLVAVELVGLAALHRGLQRLAPDAPLAKPLLWGLALNPIPILLTCQHGNFDALVGLWVLLAALALVAYGQGGRAVDWLLACLCTGLGVLTKTVPLILAPLLLPGALRADAKTRLLGAALLVLPAALPTGALYALAPEAVWRHVVSYRSQSGYFGLTGLLGSWYGRLAPLVLLAAAVLIGRRALKEEGLAPREVLLSAALLLACVPALGPGYAPQYAAWILPLLAATFVLDEDRSWRLLLKVLLAVAVPTYLVEYALLPSHGMSLVYLTDNPALRDLGEGLGQPFAQTLLRLPLFAGYLALLWFGAKRLGIRLRP